MSDVLKIIKEQKLRKKEQVDKLQSSYNEHKGRKKKKKRKQKAKTLDDKNSVSGLRRKISNWKQSQEKLPPIPKTKVDMEKYIDYVSEQKIDLDYIENQKDVLENKYFKDNKELNT